MSNPYDPREQPNPYVQGPYQAYGTSPYPYSSKSKTTAGLLQLLLPFVGICGVGRLYAGHITIGLIQLIGLIVSSFLVLVLIGFLLVPAFWLWGVIDGIVMLTSKDFRDGDGFPMR